MTLVDFEPPVKLRLSVLWASTVACYVYGDYFGLYVPGALAGIGRGDLGPAGHATPLVLVSLSAMMAIPSLMIALAVLLPAQICRWANIVLGLVYAAIVAVSVPGAEPFYKLMSAIEIALTLSISFIAFRWPRGVRNA